MEMEERTRRKEKIRWGFVFLRKEDRMTWILICDSDKDAT